MVFDCGLLGLFCACGLFGLFDLSDCWLIMLVVFDFNCCCNFGFYLDV